MFLVLTVLILWALYSYLLTFIPVSIYFLFLWVPLGLILALLTILIFFLLLVTLSSRKHQNGKFRHFILRNACYCGIKLFHIKLEIEGKENVDRNKTYLVVGNHKSQMDPVMAYYAMHIPCSAVGKSTLFKSKMLTLIGNTFGAVPLNRENDREAIKSLNIAIKNIKNGLSMIIYPEGGILSRDYEEMRDLRAGAYKIALKTGVPVLPISTIGSSKIASKKWYQKKVVKIIIHKPVEKEEYEGMSTTELGQKCMEIINSSII